VEPGHTAHADTARIAEHLGFSVAPFRLDSQVKYATVARGSGEVYLEIPADRGHRDKIWDHASGALLVQEAGGKVTDIEGRPLDFRQGRTLASNLGVIATNGKVHDAILEAIRNLGIGRL
jgi:3'(2'), 5'-bisphosphate nucleotidase